jgi:hypothetical protein
MPPAPRYPRARKVAIVLLAIIAAPVIFIAFLATLDRSR